MAYEDVISWRAIVVSVPVIASDGKEVGKVLDVAALPEEDIFHGVVYKSEQTGHTVIAPRDDIDRITPDAWVAGDVGGVRRRRGAASENIEPRIARALCIGSQARVCDFHVRAGIVGRCCIGEPIGGAVAHDDPGDGDLAEVRLVQRGTHLADLTLDAGDKLRLIT